MKELLRGGLENALGNVIWWLVGTIVVSFTTIKVIQEWNAWWLTGIALAALLAIPITREWVTVHLIRWPIAYGITAIALGSTILIHLGVIMPRGPMLAYITMNLWVLDLGLLVTIGAVLGGHIFVLRRTIGALALEPVEVLFQENFGPEWQKRWYGAQNWSADAGILTVIRADMGIITREGTDWTDYELCFDAHIVSANLGVIIRATDQDNFYMLQITGTNVRPHCRRRSAPKSWKGLWQWRDDLAQDHRCSIQGWFPVRVVVNGRSVSLYINGLRAFHDRGFIKTLRGAIGFRCSAHERAEVKNVKVVRLG